MQNVKNYGDITINNYDSQQLFVSGIMSSNCPEKVENAVNYGNIDISNIKNSSDGGQIFVSGVFELLTTTYVNKKVQAYNIGNQGNMSFSGDITKLLCGGTIGSAQFNYNIENCC